MGGRKKSLRGRVTATRRWVEISTPFYNPVHVQAAAKKAEVVVARE